MQPVKIILCLLAALAATPLAAKATWLTFDTRPFRPIAADLKEIKFDYIVLNEKRVNATIGAHYPILDLQLEGDHRGHPHLGVAVEGEREGVGGRRVEADVHPLGAGDVDVAAPAIFAGDRSVLLQRHELARMAERPVAAVGVGASVGRASVGKSHWRRRTQEYGRRFAGWLARTSSTISATSTTTEVIPVDTSIDVASSLVVIGALTLAAELGGEGLADLEFEALLKARLDLRIQRRLNALAKHQLQPGLGR